MSDELQHPHLKDRENWKTVIAAELLRRHGTVDADAESRPATPAEASLKKTAERIETMSAGDIRKFIGCCRKQVTQGAPSKTTAPAEPKKQGLTETFRVIAHVETHRSGVFGTFYTSEVAELKFEDGLLVSAKRV